MKRTTTRTESIIYLSACVILLALPLISACFQFWLEREDFEWGSLLYAWKHIIFFVIAFFIHNAFLSPLLVYRHRTVLYICCTVVLVALFTVNECAQRPPLPPKHLNMEPPGLGINLPHKEHRPPVIFGQHDVVAVIFLLLLLALNNGTKVYFRQRDKAQRMKEMEQERIGQQLSYLRYQVNPHFLMNTLNNIHALVDIDSGAAQDAIVQLSRLLRYTLYDGDKQIVPLAREVEFLQHYIALMRIRYTEQVDIRFSTPQPIPVGGVPPLLYATFVENAFKHGVSYQHPSFVDISFSVSDNLVDFSCRNSHFDSTPLSQGGLGLSNVRQRLQLLFPNNYTYEVKEESDTYSVHLVIPLSPIV